jgi:regulator of RNase E activity RraA
MDNVGVRLSALDSCAVSDALDKLGLQGVVIGIPRVSSERRISGRVLTVKLGAAVDSSTPTRHLSTTAVEAATPGDIIVVEQRSGIDAAGWGGNLSLAAKLRGIAGAIVDGPARDIDESRELDFPVFARSLTCHTARGRLIQVSTNQTIRVGDVSVSLGDYVVADGSAVVFIAQEEILRVLETAEAIVAREKTMAEALRSGTPVSQVMGSDYERMLKM